MKNNKKIFKLEPKKELLNHPDWKISSYNDYVIVRAENYYFALTVAETNFFGLVPSSENGFLRIPYSPWRPELVNYTELKNSEFSIKGEEEILQTRFFKKEE